MSSSETAAFTDPVFLQNHGLTRITVLDYFLHTLNPFKSKKITSNEILARRYPQGFIIEVFMQRGSEDSIGPMTLAQAEDKYRNLLLTMKGEQYDLLPPPPQPRGAPPMDISMEPCRLFTIRHILRSGPTDETALGIYYVLDGVIYKSPSVRALLKSSVARTIQGLEDACDALSGCAWYEPGTGYAWNFEVGAGGTQNLGGGSDGNEDEADILDQMRMGRRKRRRRILDNRRPGERTEEEEEGIRAKEKINAILSRLRKRTLMPAA